MYWENIKSSIERIMDWDLFVAIIAPLIVLFIVFVLKIPRRIFKMFTKYRINRISTKFKKWIIDKRKGCNTFLRFSILEITKELSVKESTLYLVIDNLKSSPATQNIFHIDTNGDILIGPTAGDFINRGINDIKT